MSKVDRVVGNWRRLLLAGWAMFAVSFVLPAIASPSLFGPPPPPPPPSEVTETPDAEPVQPADTGGPDEPAESPLVPAAIPGWEAAIFAILFVTVMSSVEDLVAVLSGLSNLLLLLTFLKLGGVRPPESRWLIRLVAGAAVLNLYWALSALFGWPHFWRDGMGHLRVGYWVWVASFICVASALLLRDRESAGPT